MSKVIVLFYIIWNTIYLFEVSYFFLKAKGYLDFEFKLE